MTSAPFEPIGGTVDAQGRLTAADPQLERLQREAGSELGLPLAVPQLASIARLARRLRVTISRPALAASAEADLELWVRAEPQNGNVQLTIESWAERTPQRPRWPDNGAAPASGSASDEGFELDASAPRNERSAASGSGGTSELDELLRLPLDRIVTEAQHIAERAEGPLRRDYATYAGDIMAASRHLLGVLRSMSAGARDAADSESSIDLVALTLEAAGLVQAQAAEAEVMLEVDGETALHAQGDGRAVTQILVNLIGNAARHSPRGGTIRITAAHGATAEVRIADEGPGVADSDRERIFEPFQQGVANGLPAGGGVGLGLAIARRLARSMGGDILLDSAPGTGARFILSLPLA